MFPVDMVLVGLPGLGDVIALGAGVGQGAGEVDALDVVDNVVGMPAEVSGKTCKVIKLYHVLS